MGLDDNLIGSHEDRMRVCEELILFRDDCMGSHADKS